MSAEEPTVNARAPDGQRAPAFALRATGVSFSYGTPRAVAEVSLELPRGKVVAVVGPNGCGKSTLLKLLCGQLVPQAGSVIAGLANPRDLQTLAPADIARLVALVPQSTSVGFDYSVRQIVLMARWATHARAGLATALGFETAADHRLADAAMWAMDVHHLADRPITQLSGGERQRVIVARALAQETPIVLLDEPASALDLWHQLELFAQLGQLAHAEGKAILMVTHDLNHALAYADHVVLMDAGRVVAAGLPPEVLTAANLEPVYRVSVQVGSARVLAFARQSS